MSFWSVLFLICPLAWKGYFIVQPWFISGLNVCCVHYSTVNVTEVSWRTKGALNTPLSECFSGTESRLTYRQVCLYFTKPLSYHIQVALTHQSIFKRRKREWEKKKVCLWSMCVWLDCVSLCVSTASGIPRPGPLLQVQNEKSTLTLQKWIRKHRGRNYRAPWRWNWRRWSANRSVSNHPPAACPL